MTTMSPFVGGAEEDLADGMFDPYETFEEDAQANLAEETEDGQQLTAAPFGDLERRTMTDWASVGENGPVDDAPLLAEDALPELEASLDRNVTTEALPTMAETYWETGEEEGASAERAAVEKAIAAGSRDVNELTNLVFYKRHPSLTGLRIPAGRKDLEAEWVRIKRQVVLPVLEAGSAARASTSALTEFQLRYEGDPAKTRRITKSDPEFQAGFVDNFVRGTAVVNKIEGKIDKLELEYRDGRKLLVDWQRVPVHYRGTVQTGFVDYFLKARDGFIYPVFDGKIAYSLTLTPNLVLARSDLEVRVQVLQKLSQLTFLGGAFAAAIAASASAIGTVGGVLMKSGATNVELLQP